MNKVKLRTDFDISDEDFDRIMVPFIKELDLWLLKHKSILNEFVALNIASGVKHNVLWNGKYSGLVEGSLDTLVNYINKDLIDSDVVNDILIQKYKLKVVNEDPLVISKIN